MGISIQISGDWDLALRTLQNIKNNMHDTFRDELRDSAEYTLEKLQGHIDKQDLGWTPLTEHTVQLKGGSRVIMVETGALRNSFEVQEKGDTFYVGVNSSSHPSGESTEDIVKWLEYGTDKMVPRPLFQPTYKEIQRELPKRWSKTMQDLIGG